jgi:hypothetical protein
MNDFQKVLELCNGVSSKLMICFDIVEKDMPNMQRLINKLFKRISVQKYELHDFLQLESQPNNPLGFKKHNEVESVENLEQKIKRKVSKDQMASSSIKSDLSPKNVESNDQIKHFNSKSPNLKI